MLQEFRNRPREEAGERIECYIMKNQLKPHDRLPSERNMCEIFGFNRTTLRGAISHLILKGILYSRKGSGTFVAPPKLIRNLQDLKPFSETVREANKSLSTQVVSKRVLESNKQISKRLQVFLGHKVLELIRMRSIDGDPVMIEITYVDHKKYQMFDGHDFSKESLYGVMEKSYGTEIAKGTEKLGITYATEDEAILLKVNKGEPLYFLTGVVTDSKGVPIEYFKSVARVDKMKFSSKLTR